MSFIYYTLATLLYVLALPVFVYLRFKPKHKESIPARFFLKHNTCFPEDGIWFHACSLGEVRSLQPFIEAIEPSMVRISVITQTGFREALKCVGVPVRYLPFEIFLPFWMTKQKVLVVMEAELWPLLFYVAKAKGMKTILLNARISDKSYRSYRRFAFVYRWIFQSIDVVFAQSDNDKKRLESLGAKNIRVGGNIKTFQHYQVSRLYTKQEGKRLVVLASTHAGEEALILSQIELLPQDQLIVVPRHPERFDEVDTFLASYAQTHMLSYSKISQHDAFEKDVILCDAMGELINVYAIADIVILGGSFVEGVGGHNPLEAAFFKKKIISGDAIFNQKVLFDLVENSVTCKANALKEVFRNAHTLLPSSIAHHGDIAPILEEIEEFKAPKRG